MSSSPAFSRQPATGADLPALDAAWMLLLELAERRRRGYVPAEAVGFTLPWGRELREAAATDPQAAIVWRAGQGWSTAAAVPTVIRDLLDLYLPLFGPCPIVLGHLGQGVDGHIATESGDSRHVNGIENIVHLHRLRALCDAVLIGPRTAARDNPRLTVRHVPGPNPVRVILDPAATLPETLDVFGDGEARTLVACNAERIPHGRSHIGQAEILAVPVTGGGRLDLAALLTALRARDMSCVFVEGGGRTVSDFLEVGLLDRLQIATAPVLMGAGRRGVQLPPVPSMAECARPPHRVFRMGGDILWDFDLAAGYSSPLEAPGLARIL